MKRTLLLLALLLTAPAVAEDKPLELKQCLSTNLNTCGGSSAGSTVWASDTGTAMQRQPDGNWIPAGPSEVIPGLSGTIGNARTFAYLTHLTAAPNLDHLPKVYFSADTTAGCPGDLPQGNDDTGRGTKAQPFRSLGRALPLIKAGQVNTVWDACDVWETNDGGTTGDNESTSFLLTNQQIEINTGTGDWARCPAGGNPRQACVAWTSTDPSGLRVPTFSSAMLDGAGQPTNEGFLQVTIIGDLGWLHMENAYWSGPWPKTCTSGNADWYEPEQNGRSPKATFLKTRWDMCSSGLAVDVEVLAGHNYNGSGPTEAAYTIFIDPRVYWPEVAGDSEGVSFATADNSAFLIIGGDSLIESVGATVNGQENSCVFVSNRATIAGSSSYGFVWGHKCIFNNSTDVGRNHGFYAQSVRAGDETSSARLVVADSAVIGANAGTGFDNGFWSNFYALNGGTNVKNQTHVGFRNSSYNNDRFIGMGSTGAGAGMEFLHTEMCSVQTAGAAGSDQLVNFNTDTDCTGVNFNFQDMLVNEIATLAIIDGTTYATIADFCGSAAARSCNDGVAWAGCDLTDLTADPFGTSGGFAGLCLGAQCANDCTQTLNETWGLGIYIPEHLLAPGLSMTGVRLGATGDPIGR